MVLLSLQSRDLCSSAMIICQQCTMKSGISGRVIKKLRYAAATSQLAVHTHMCSLVTLIASYKYSWQQQWIICDVFNPVRKKCNVSFLKMQSIQHSKHLPSHCLVMICRISSAFCAAFAQASSEFFPFPKPSTIVCIRSSKKIRGSSV